ncbi:2OG-Fe(II) oxygenase [Pseudomonas gingeri]|uniref:2OG-Fe(II) oxygenase n=1 Tax=Pseudomonas gingeri TaxID=117681 RepID=UPI0015A1C79A|nr:2OG-Fe(II) oxygenase [Pseudomonas gingeri]NWA29796.1 2OG-Fe(II) oxygenase [Pseudomonas gingeri]NWD69015.1 2OG-Fe(II) oxygenase [Pseudomonas gingeri]
MNSFAERLVAGATASSTSVELPLGDSVRCVLVHGFLSTSECEALVEATEKCGFANAGSDYPSSYRDNDRIVADDPALAGRLFERLTHCASRMPRLGTVLDEEGWRMVGVNERLRFCRYRPGTQFRAHQDGVHHRQSTQSRLTFMIYLNDDAFSGGETVFFEGRSAAMSNRDSTLRLRPRKGSLIVFDHTLWHAGALVDAGQKYVMRSDLMYEPLRSPQVDGPFQPGHRGYVWALADLGDMGFASAGRDATIRLWDREGRSLGQFDGHTQSILGLVESAPGELVSHSRDRTIRHWSLATGKSKVVGTSDSAVLSSARLGCGRLVTGAADGRVTVWNLATGASDRRQAHASWIWAIAPLGDGSFATASEDRTVRLWQPEGWDCADVIDLGRPLRTLASWIDTDGGVILAAGDLDGTVHLLASVPTLTRMDCLAAHDGPVRRVRFEARHVLLTCGEDGFVSRWDLLSRQGDVIGKHENFATDVLPTNGCRWISCGYDGRIIMHGAKI